MTLGKIRSLIVLGVLLLIALVVVIWAVVVSSSPPSASCQYHGARFRVTKPKPADVKVRILNATQSQGLADNVASGLKKRGFTVTDVGNAPANEQIAATAVISYGPKGLAAATELKPSFAGAVMELDASRSSDKVTVSVGAAFDGLLDTKKANKVAAGLPTPTVPPGCKTS